MWKPVKSAALALLAATTLSACDLEERAGAVSPEEPVYAAIDQTFSHDTARVFAQLERLGNPLAMEVFVNKREHTAYDAFPPTRDPGHFTDDYIDLISRVFNRPRSLAVTVANVLLGTEQWPGDMIKYYPNRAPGVTAMNAANNPNMVGWLTYVLNPGMGAGGRTIYGDDVVDKGLGIVFGEVVTPVNALIPGLRSDNVNMNDVQPMTTFPYLPDFHRAPRPPTGPGGDRVGLRMVAQGLTNPLALAEAPDGTGRIFIVEQPGLIRVLNRDGTLRDQPFLDVRDRIVPLMPTFDERGLLGLAFHPKFADNGRFFIYYTAPPRRPDYNNTSTVAEYRVQPGVADARPSFVRIVLQEDQPQFNHEGGTLAFGPDGYLYISIGDGGGRDDEGEGPPRSTPVFGHVPDWYERNAGGNGQDIKQNLLGSILRIDVNSGNPYAIPPDNPFVGRDGLDEIYAYGFRNPYRFSFDMSGSHTLLAGDAGQDLWEEIDVVVKGGNYGWNVKEGRHCFDAEEPKTVPATCPSVDPTTGEPLRDPVIELLNHHNPRAQEGEGIAVIIGGYVYRGNAIPELQGQYIFGAFSVHHLDEKPAGVVYAARPGSASSMWPVRKLEFAGTSEGSFPHFVLGFGQDLSGEVYVLTTDSAGPTGSSGKVYRLVKETR